VKNSLKNWIPVKQRRTGNIIIWLWIYYCKVWSL